MSRDFHRAVAHASLAKVGAGVSGLAAHLLAVRVLGVSGYGHFVLAESVAMALSIVALCGVNVSCFALVGDLRGRGLATALKAGGLLIAAISTGEALIAATLAALPLGLAPAIAAWTAPAFAAVTGLSLYRYASELLRIGRSVKLANYFSGRANGFAAAAIFALLVAACALLHRRLTATDLLWLFAGGQWLGALAALALLASPLHASRRDAGAWGLMREFVRRGPTISVTQGLQIAQANMDLWLIGLLGSPAMLGIYGLAKRFAMWLVAPTGLVALSAKKRAVDEYLSAGRVSAELEAAFRVAVWRSWKAVLAIVSGACLIPADWLQMMAGPHASQSRWLFVALGAGQLLRLLFGNGGPILGAAGHEASNLRAHLWGVFAAATTGLLLVPPLQAWGAAAGYSAGMIVTAVLMSRACQREMGFACDLVHGSFGKRPRLPA